MRISSIETFPVALPFRERYETATGSLERREMILVRLAGSEGHVGWGDAVPLSLRGGPTLAAIGEDLERIFRPLLEEVELDLGHPPAEAGAAIGPVLDAARAAGAGAGAISAIEIALLDLLGHAYDVPAWVVLGAPAAHPVECNGTLGAGMPEMVAAAARRLVDVGFGTLKVKVGRGDDDARIEAIREACGEAVALRIDANGAWSVEEAEAKLAGMAQAGLELVEQPCADVGELAELRRRVEVPIVADESAATQAEAKRCKELGACDAVTIKLAKVGGVRTALHIAEAVPAYLSSALDSPLGIAAALHASQAMPAGGFAAGLAHGLATSGLFADNVADDAALSGPSITPPPGPGLGVAIDDAALSRLAAVDLRRR